MISTMDTQTCRHTCIPHCCKLLVLVCRSDVDVCELAVLAHRPLHRLSHRHIGVALPLLTFYSLGALAAYFQHPRGAAAGGDTWGKGTEIHPAISTSTRSGVFTGAGSCIVGRRVGGRWRRAVVTCFTTGPGARSVPRALEGIRPPRYRRERARLAGMDTKVCPLESLFKMPQV